MSNGELDAAAAGLWAGRPETVPELLSIYGPLIERLSWKRSDGNQRVSIDEYLAFASAAAWQAIMRYDPANERGASGSTFIEWRIRGELCEAERANDWVRPKTRAAAKAGLIDLPGMHRLKPTFDQAAGDAEADAGQRLGELFGRADTVVRALAERMIACGHDAVELAQRLQCSPEFAGYVRRWVVSELQETPCPA